MSNSAFNVAVLGANAYQKRFSSLSYNLAASGAVAGRAKDTFITAFDLNRNSIEGVQSADRRFLSEIAPSNKSHEATNLGINGSGFACVQNSLNSNTIGYARDGTFALDDNKYLVNNLNQYLCGFLTDTQGKIIGGNQSLANLQPLNVGSAKIDPSATTQIKHSISFDNQMNNFDYNTVVYSPTGAQETLTFNWTKDTSSTVVATNSVSVWTLTVSASNSTINPPYDSGVRVELDENGNILDYVVGTSSAVTSAPALSLTWIEPGLPTATPLSTNINLAFDPPSFSHNGARGVGISNGFLAGTFESIAFDKDGYGQVTYSNQKVLPYCRIPLALFNNINALNESQAGFFEASGDSGEALLGFPNAQNYGQIKSGYIESSTVNAAGEYLKMIENQRDYIMNLKSIEVAKTMNAKLENI